MYTETWLTGLLLGDSSPFSQKSKVLYLIHGHENGRWDWGGGKDSEQGIPPCLASTDPVNPGVIVRHCGHTHNTIEGIGGEGGAKTVLLRV